VVGLLHRLNCSPVGRFYAKLSADRAMTGAIQIAWQAMFSSFPLIIGVLGLFGLVLRDPAQRLRLAEAVASQFPSQVGDLLGFIEETRQLGGLLGAVSLLGLLWSGYWLFQTMELVFNHFYGAPDRSFRQQVVMALMMIGIYAALFSLSVLASTAAGLLVSYSERVARHDFTGVDPVIGWLVALASAIAMFAAIYRVVPNTRLSVAHVWPGALLSGVLFVILSQTFPLYFSVLGSSYAAYKTLGLFLMLMTWFYCLAVILVLGVELNAFLGGYEGAATAQVAAMQVLIAAPAEGTDGDAPQPESAAPMPSSSQAHREIAPNPVPPRAAAAP
jgi:membrane protein